MSERERERCVFGGDRSENKPSMAKAKEPAFDACGAIFNPVAAVATGLQSAMGGTVNATSDWLTGEPVKEMETLPTPVFNEVEFDEGFAKLKRDVSLRRLEVGKLNLDKSSYVQSLDRTESSLDEEYTTLDQRLRSIKKRSLLASEKERELQRVAEGLNKEASKLHKQGESKAAAEQFTAAGAAQQKAIKDQLTRGLRQDQMLESMRANSSGAWSALHEMSSATERHHPSKSTTQRRRRKRGPRPRTPAAPAAVDPPPASGAAFLSGLTAYVPGGLLNVVGMGSPVASPEGAMDVTDTKQTSRPASPAKFSETVAEKTAAAVAKSAERARNEEVAQAAAAADLSSRGASLVRRENLLIKKEEKLMAQVEEMRTKLVKQTEEEMKAAAEKAKAAALKQQLAKALTEKLHLEEKSMMWKMEMLAKQEAELRANEEEMLARRASFQQHRLSLKDQKEALGSLEIEMRAQSQAAKEHGEMVKGHMAEQAAQAAKEAEIIESRRAAIAQQERELRERDAEIAKRAAEEEERLESLATEMQRRQEELEKDGHLEAAKALALVEREAALKVEAASVERRKADLKAQEDFLLRREEEAKCHEKAMKLRETRLLETKLAVSLKKAVLKTRQREIHADEEEHEHELETYREEVKELKNQLEAQRELVRKEAAALALQRRQSMKILQAERPLSRGESTESEEGSLTRTHSMPQREAAGHHHHHHHHHHHRKHHHRSSSPKKQASLGDLFNSGTKALWAPFQTKAGDEEPAWLHDAEVDLAHDHLPTATNRASQVVHHAHI